MQSRLKTPVTLIDYLVPAAVGVVFVVLALGLWNMLRGGSPNTSQKLMRLRVVAQFLAILVILAVVYFAAR
jgi:Hypoxia induced protein conserved region